MTLHVLKTWPAYFQPVVDGNKTFDVRYDDRGFQAGDLVQLREWDLSVSCECRSTAKSHGEDCPRYTGRQIEARVGWVMASAPRLGHGAAFLGNGYVVLALCDQVFSDARAVRGPTPEDLARLTARAP